MPGAAAVTIRDERGSDAASLRDLIATAFRAAPHASGTEQDIVDRLRAAEALSLSLVAEAGGAAVGHVAASPVRIGGRPGWFAIGPLAVLPGWQARGIGSALMKAAQRRLRAQGATGVVLVGDPAYYRRFGFRADPRVTVAHVPSEYVLVLPLGAGEAAGEVRFHPAFGLEP